MTPEERLDAHEQWLLDHDRQLADATARHDREMAEIRAILLTVAQTLAHLTGAKDGDDGT